MLSEVRIFVTNTLVNASPLANEYIGRLNKDDKMMASKKELGWLAAINSGPVWRSISLLLILILRQ
jgi:hypothetical protein